MKTTKGRRSIVNNRAELANILAKLEGGKHQAIVADIREVLKLMVALETALIVRGYKSANLIIRREALEKARKIIAKRSGKGTIKDVLSSMR